MNKDGSDLRIKPKSMKAWKILFRLTSLLGIKHKAKCTWRYADPFFSMLAKALGVMKGIPYL